MNQKAEDKNIFCDHFLDDDVEKIVPGIEENLWSGKIFRTLNSL